MNILKMLFGTKNERDLKRIAPIVEQIKKMFGRCKRVWADYCDFIKLPRESRQLFVTKAKKEWHRREEELKQQGIQKRKRSHSVDS